MLGLDRLRAGLEAIVEARLRPRIDYLALYPSTVVSQNGAWLLELLPDNPRVRGEGCTGIRLRNGLPGFSCRVEKGSRVVLGFEDGDPSKPFAALWEPSDGGDVTEVVFDDGSDAVARVGDTAGELYAQTVLDPVINMQVVILLWYRSGSGAWAPIVSSPSPPPTPGCGTPIHIDSGNDKLLA